MATGMAGGLLRHRLTRVSDKMREYVERGKLSGVVSLVYRHGEIAHLDAVGMADIETRAAMQTDTIFRIFSMTKPVTSVAILMLVEEGRLRLSDRLATFVPAFQNGKVLSKTSGSETELVDAHRSITIYDLLTHTSGLSYGFNDDPLDQHYRDAFWQVDPNVKPGSEAMLNTIARLPLAHDEALDVLVDRLAVLPLAFQPGAEFRYSVATDVLGRIVEIVSGMSLPDFLHQRIFGPLKMNDTGFHVSAQNASRFTSVTGLDAEGHLYCRDRRDTSLFLKPPICALGGSGLVSTAEDFLKFASMMINNGAGRDERLLSRTTVELMTRDHLPAGVDILNDSAFGFGLGVSVQRDKARCYRSSSPGTYGWAGAASTDYWTDPHEDMIGILMVQSMPGPDTPIVEEMRNLVYAAIGD